MISWLWLIPTFILGAAFGAWALFVSVRAMVRRVEKDVERRRRIMLNELVSRINKDLNFESWH